MRFLAIAFFFLINLPAYCSGFSFVENQGQWDSSIKFKSDIPGGFLLVKDNSIEYIFYSTEALANLHAAKSNGENLIPTTRIVLNFLESNVENSVEKSGQYGHTSNYFIGKDPAFWKTNVPAYSELTIKNLYNFIDFRIYTITGQLKYEYIVHP
ncbi:MAG: hypothetical protein NWQ46_04015, partial [Spirosomaceae bacterium]|nr:hypothetical protein [Spirosomataceae bacterium]